MFKVDCGKGEMIGVENNALAVIFERFGDNLGHHLFVCLFVCLLVVCLYIPSQFFPSLSSCLYSPLIKDSKIRSAVLSAESSIFWPWHAEMTFEVCGMRSPAENTSRKRESSLTALKLWFVPLTFFFTFFIAINCLWQTLNSLTKLKQGKKWKALNKKFLFVSFPPFHHFVKCVQSFMS